MLTPQENAWPEGTRELLSHPNPLARHWIVAVNSGLRLSLPSDQEHKVIVSESCGHVLSLEKDVKPLADRDIEKLN